MTLDFSSRYSEIFAPITAPVGVNIISRYFPKRLELSLMAVQAFPNASTRGFTWRIFSRKARLLALTEQIQIRRIIKKCIAYPQSNSCFRSIASLSYACIDLDAALTFLLIQQQSQQTNDEVSHRQDKIHSSFSAIVLPLRCHTIS